jgi:hypothetical protein
MRVKTVIICARNEKHNSILIKDNQIIYEALIKCSKSTGLVDLYKLNIRSVENTILFFHLYHKFGFNFIVKVETNIPLTSELLHLLHDYKVANSHFDMLLSKYNNKLVTDKILKENSELYYLVSLILFYYDSKLEHLKNLAKDFIRDTRTY